MVTIVFGSATESIPLESNAYQPTETIKNPSFLPAGITTVLSVVLR